MKSQLTIFIFFLKKENKGLKVNHLFGAPTVIEFPCSLRFIAYPYILLYLDKLYKE